MSSANKSKSQSSAENSNPGKPRRLNTSRGKGSGQPLLREPVQEYASAKSIHRSAVPVSQLSSFEKMSWVKEGVSKDALEEFKERASLDYDALAKLLSVTRSTLIGKKKGEYFTGPLGERIIDLAGIYSYGYEIFKDEQRFNHWVMQPNRALAGQAPIDVMDNQFGRSEVRDIIGRIAWGVYS